MIGFSGARVLVVDDNVGEAVPILEAFAKRGIPTAFFDGSSGGLPSQSRRLRGVRLAILDMVLVPGATSDAARISPLLSTLDRILSPDNGPYAVLIWTAHSELRDIFEQRVFQHTSIPKPILTVMVEKSDCKNRGGTFNLVRLAHHVENALAGTSPLLLLQAWEEKSFESATDVTNGLSSLIAAGGNDLAEWRRAWESGVFRLMHSLAKAQMGAQLNEKTFLSGLYSSLNPLHADRMESRMAKTGAPLAQAAAAAMGAGVGSSREARARINTMLHLAMTDLDRFFAGNVYRSGPGRGPSGAPGTSTLLNDLLQHPEDATRRELVSSQSVPVLVECTPACDHAQNNIRVARFIAGMLVPDNQECNREMKKADFVWRFGPVYLGNQLPVEGAYNFYLSARHGVTLDLKRAARLRPIARLRATAFADLQAWLSRHSGRPGMVTL